MSVGYHHDEAFLIGATKCELEDLVLSKGQMSEDLWGVISATALRRALAG